MTLPSNPSKYRNPYRSLNSIVVFLVSSLDRKGSFAHLWPNLTDVGWILEFVGTYRFFVVVHLWLQSAELQADSLDHLRVLTLTFS
jgi:hypothetical protein